MNKLTAFTWYSQLDEQIENVEVYHCGTYFHIVQHVGPIGHHSFNIFNTEDSYEDMKEIVLEGNEELFIRYVQKELDDRDAYVLGLFE